MAYNVLYQPTSLLNSTKFCIAAKLCKTVKWHSVEAEQAVKKIKHLKIPHRLYPFIWQGILLFEKGYAESYDWFHMYRGYIEIFENNSYEYILKDSQYNFGAFITPTGQFDDLTWVNKFVHDSEQCLLDRFTFACCYCFEKDIRLLWKIISPARGTPYYNKKRIFYPTLVCFWIHCLNGRQDKLLSKARSTESLYLYGVRQAVEGGQENAFHYFFEQLSSQDIEYFLSNTNSYTEIIHCTAEKNLKLAYFLFSILSLEQRRSVLHNELKAYPNKKIWSCYLQMRCFTLSIEQILLNHESIRPDVYNKILHQLACNIEQGNYICIEAFQDIWNLGSSKQKRYAFNHDFRFILKAILVTKHFTCAKMLLKESLFEIKGSFLTTTFSRDIIEKFCSQKDWSAIKNFIDVFLIDLQQEKYSTFMPFHIKSLAYLKRFKEDIYSSQWMTELNKEEVAPIKKILDNLSHCIEANLLLNDLIMETEENVLHESSKQATLLQSTETKQEIKNELRTIQREMFNLSTPHKRVHSDSVSDIYLQGNGSFAFADELETSFTKKMKS